MTIEDVIAALESLRDYFEDKERTDDYAESKLYAACALAITNVITIVKINNIKNEEGSVPRMREHRPFCGKCERMIYFGDVYCHGCGTKIKWPWPQVQKENNDEFKD